MEVGVLVFLCVKDFMEVLETKSRKKASDSDVDVWLEIVALIEGLD